MSTLAPDPTAAFSAALHLTIGGVTFDLRAPRALHFPDPDGTYSPFLAAAGRGGGRVAVTVTFVDEPIPAHAGRPVLFDAGAWRLYDLGDSRLAVWPGRGSGEALWAAKWPGDMHEARVYCPRRFAACPQGPLACPLRYPLDQILMMHLLPRHAGALVHAAGAVFGTSGVVFAGRSGAGKSTLARLIRDTPGCSGALQVLSDDRVVLRRTGRGFDVHGTPWAGELGIARKASGPVRALVFLGRGVDNALDPLSPADAVERLLPVCSTPWYDRTAVQRTLDLLGELANSVPAYVFRFRPDGSAAEAVARLAAS